MSIGQVRIIPECDASRSKRATVKKKEKSHSSQNLLSAFTTITKQGIVTEPKTLERKNGGLIIGGELRRAFAENPALEQSIREAVRQIDSQIGEGDIEAYIEHDMDEPSITRPVIKVEIDINSVDEWVEKKSIIRDIVRSTEKDDVMIYTVVDRKR